MYHRIRKITQMGRKIGLYKTGIKTCLHIFLLVFETYVSLYQICTLLLLMTFKGENKKNGSIWLERKCQLIFFILFSKLDPKEVTTESKGLAYSTTYPTAPMNNSCSETQLSSSFLKDLFVLLLSVYMPVRICYMYVCQMCICYMYVCHMCIYATCVKVSMAIRKGHQMPRTWGYSWLWANWYGCWQPNSGPLQEQVSVLTSEPSLTSHFIPWLFKVRKVEF